MGKILLFLPIVITCMFGVPLAIGAALDFGLYAGAGLGSATISSQSTSLPETFHYSGGGFIGISPFRVFALGAVGELQMVNQTSEAKSPYGNRTGKRTALGNPYLDINLKVLRLRYVHQMFGDFELTNPTSGGQTISYQDPSGYRGEVHVCAIRGKERFYKLPGKCYVYAGGYYEKTEFGSEKTGSAVPVALANPLVLEHYGLMLGVGF